MSSAAESMDQDLKVQDPRIGLVVQDRYRIVRRLGEGGMGVVYEGEHLMIKRRVAIKLLHTQFAADPMVVRRFHNEAIAATSIGNAHIVEVTDMGRLPDGTFFMVLEFLEGHDFDHLIEKEGPQPVGRTAHILSQTCDALQAAHDKGIIHRDLKPENLYLIGRGDDPHFVKVLDFGIAKFRDTKDESMTQTGQTIGTPHFMSPEQLQGSKDLDLRADLYALGVILYHALTKRFPFEAETFPLLIMSIFNHPPVPITAYRQDLPPELVHIIERLLAKNPAHRFGSAAELKAMLAPFRQVATAPVMLSPPPMVQHHLPGSGPQPVTGPFGGQGSYPGSYGPPGSYPGPPGSYPGQPGSYPGQPGSYPGQAGSYPGQPGSYPGQGGAPPPMAYPGTAQHTAPGMPVGSAPNLSVPGTMVPTSAPSSKLPMVLALGAVLVALAVVIVVGVGFGGGDTRATTGTNPTPTEPADPAVELVNVHIAVTPPSARLFLDGDPITNPFITQMPASRDSRRLEARLDGYLDRSEVVSLRYPLHITWALEREPEPPAPARPQEVQVAATTPPPATTGRGRRGNTTAASPGTSVLAAPREHTPPPRVNPMVSQPTGGGSPPGGGLKRIRF